MRRSLTNKLYSSVGSVGEGTMCKTLHCAAVHEAHEQVQHPAQYYTRRVCYCYLSSTAASHCALVTLRRGWAFFLVNVSGKFIKLI